MAANATRKVYTVTDSEFGLLHVFGSFRKAHDWTVATLAQHGQPTHNVNTGHCQWESRPVTYKLSRELLNRYDFDALAPVEYGVGDKVYTIESHTLG